MLDTATYFESRWTSQEFGRALAKSLVPVRIGWPGVVVNGRSLSGESLQLAPANFDASGALFTTKTLQSIGRAIEKARSRGAAVRTAEINGAVILAAEKINGKFLGLGPKRTIVIELLSGHKVLVLPSVGVPTAEHLHEVSTFSGVGDSRAVVYDDAGVSRSWQDHLKWLGDQISAARWLKKGHAAWELAVWLESAK